MERVLFPCDDQLHTLKINSNHSQKKIDALKDIDITLFSNHITYPTCLTLFLANVFIKLKC